MGENTHKFEIKIDPLDLHIGLKDKMAEFESLIRMESPGKKLAEQVENDLKSRFCHCCFFGHVEGELMGEPLCKECAKILYGFDANEERPSIKKIDPYYQLWFRRKKALPIFEAYLHAELERFKLEQKLEEAKESAYAESVDAGMRERRLKRALWLARAERAHSIILLWNVYCYQNNSLYFRDFMNEKCNPFRNLPKKTAMEWSDLWETIEIKCRAKAEEYK